MGEAKMTTGHPAPKAARRWPAATRPLLLMAAALGLGGLQEPPRIGPNGDGTLLRSDDRDWLVLQGARIAADVDKGEYTAQFDPALARMDGQRIRLSGYMLPVETETAGSHFVMTRRSASCPFCAPPGLTEAVEVFLSRRIRYTLDPVTVTGRLHLVRRSEAGLFYRIDDAVAG